MSKNDISCKFSIFDITKKWLIIFEKSLIQIEAMDCNYHFFRAEMVLIEVLQTNIESENVSEFAYINRAGTRRLLP